MAREPCEDMRGCILDTETYNLAEQAGMFCDGLEPFQSMADFSGTEFIFDADEPYEIYFEWRFGDVSAGLSFMADRDNSVWFVSSIQGRKRSRQRSCMTDFHTRDAEAFMRCLSDTLKRM